MPQTNAHTDVFSIAMGLIFSLDLHLDPYFLYAQTRQINIEISCTGLCSDERIIGPVKQINLRKIAIILLTISLNMCFGCSKEPSHRDGSFEYPQHMFWLRNKKIISSYALLSRDLDNSA